ncbi:hypothetical protein E2562_010368 [Oryza meyeriana var. granulata]|uniref:Uncharacterized protein n=1 Tax=Oryza meyeriana var. granulata TaxID=110450 RepID=A0A6G1F6C6_9ORYZ|nr:hypothetical protein E2562_010368 [Oryza meyeriana var. granulata]
MEEYMLIEVGLGQIPCTLLAASSWVGGDKRRKGPRQHWKAEVEGLRRSSSPRASLLLSRCRCPLLPMPAASSSLASNRSGWQRKWTGSPSPLLGCLAARRITRGGGSRAVAIGLP